MKSATSVGDNGLVRARQPVSLARSENRASWRLPTLPYTALLRRFLRRIAARGLLSSDGYASYGGQGDGNGGHRERNRHGSQRCPRDLDREARQGPATANHDEMID